MKPFAGKSVALWVEEIDELAQLGSALARLGFVVHSVDTAPKLKNLIGRGAVDVVIASLSGFSMGRREPMKLLPWVRAVENAPKVVVAVDQWDKDLYLEALQLGAFDGIALPLDEKELIRILSRAVAALPGEAGAPQLQKTA